MGFLVRDIHVVPRKITTQQPTTQLKRSCKNCETHTHHSENAIKRRLLTKDNHNEVQENDTLERFKEINHKFIVTRPNKVYNQDELVPPSFLLPENFYSDRKNIPSTFQSYLVRQKYQKTPGYRKEFELFQNHAFSPNFNEEYLTFEPKSTARPLIKSVTSTQKTFETDDWSVHWIQM